MLLKRNFKNFAVIAVDRFSSMLNLMTLYLLSRSEKNLIKVMKAVFSHFDHVSAQLSVCFECLPICFVLFYYRFLFNYFPYKTTGDGCEPFFRDISTPTCSSRVSFSFSGKTWYWSQYSLFLFLTS